MSEAEKVNAERNKKKLNDLKQEQEELHAKKVSANKVGRPTRYTLELATKVCDYIACTTLSIQRLTVLHDWFPSRSTMMAWKIVHVEFQIMYRAAEEQRAHLFVDEIIEIADDSTNDYMESFNKDGEAISKLNAEHVQRSRLRIDARKWVSGKRLPQIYGERPNELFQSKDDVREEIVSLLQRLTSDSKKDY